MVAGRRAGGPRSRHERPREGERNEIGGAGAVAVSRAEDGAERSSLVVGKNNSRDSLSAESRQSDLSRFAEDDTDDRFDCRHIYSNFQHESAGGETAPFRCSQWACYCCAHRMRMNLIEEMERLVDERPELRRLLTLTVDSDHPRAPEDTAEQHEYITDRFNALRTTLTDRYDGLSYVWIRHEGDENGRPHLHLLVDRFLPQEELSDLSKQVGLGEVVDIRRVSPRNAAHYLTSYLGRGALAELPDGLRRYGSSGDIDLDVRGGGESDGEWELMMDDYTITPDGDAPLRRAVERMDFVQQREWEGAVPPPD